MRKFAPLLFLFLAACATVATLRLDERFGKPDPARFDRLPVEANGPAPDYWREVRPILDQRCISCHACYDAPCQLNLASYAGISRGANPAVVYSSSRLIADPPMRLGVDARTTVAWRQLGFFPVLNERQSTPEANRAGGVMHRLLEMKQRHPGPDRGPLAEADLDFSLDRPQLCVRAEGLDDYAKSHPQRGMPFGLPPLAADEHRVLSRWLEAGAPYQPPPPLPAAVLEKVADWERFLNGDSAKEQLMARYIYEHWYIGHLHFAELPGQYFELVRSKTPPGQPVDLIATRRPYDDPGVGRVYYRLQRMETTPVAKKHMPLKLDAARLERLRRWFLAPAYAVAALPGYAPEVAANPFVAFRALPVDARYRFMLDEAQFTLMGFMKGPVCRGQVALNVINDHFWVVFVAPNNRENRLMNDMVDAAMPALRLPAEHESTARLTAWRQYSELETRYLEAKSAVLAKSASKDFLPGVDKLWDGDGHNPNAALTVFRHFDSASVVRGLAGERPQTTLLLGYPLLERMHYLLVAGFDVYGNVGHQLATRLYMDFLRMEGELNFLTLLPLADRQPVLDHWYRGRSEPHIRHFADAAAFFPKETGMRYRTRDHLGELYAALRARVAGVRERSLEHRTNGWAPRETAQLQRLSAVRGPAAALMPENSLLLVSQPDGALRIVSLIRNSAHSNVAELFGEAKRRLPQEDTLLALDGVVGAYPNAFYALPAGELAAFATAVAGLGSEADLVQLTERFGVRRTDRRFWPLS
ncbi:MAG TPA: fatty acid cis/trans isomerase, partial [Azonexus sp.]